ncbi:P-loop containing nucleoside triphosphate hydrolase protein [Baffinella frigidus]|nr:P-loop containing nucleoside triphosphate hydrolase protein [Cryptophyta sp. CCMP2293]
MSEEKIQVSVRVRPLNKREVAANEKSGWRVVDGVSILPSEKGSAQGFTFDHVFDEASTQKGVYKACASNIIESTLNGQNGTIFVYGQTSSGKTHTMQGTDKDEGIVPQGISYVFDQIKQRGSKQDFMVRCSYIEIYNEVISDLLVTNGKPLKLHQDLKKGTVVAGATMTMVANTKAAMELINKGTTRRHVGATTMNEESSRSHSIFRMFIESCAKNPDGTSGAAILGELYLVDLAGSERQSQTQTTGVRLKEGANINKSLLTLSLVISKLSGLKPGGGAQHVPFRDSNLTRILQRALGGNSRTSIICTVTPAACHAEETKSTLQFAERAKSITNKASVNAILDDQAMLKSPPPLPPPPPTSCPPPTLHRTGVAPGRWLHQRWFSPGTAGM